MSDCLPAKDGFETTHITLLPHYVVFWNSCIPQGFIQKRVAFLIDISDLLLRRLGRYLAADYTIIMSRTLKVTGNHVMYDRGAWFLRVIMSSSRALCCLPSVKKQKHYFQVCFVDRARHRKSSWRQGLINTKRSTKVAKELFADYVKEKKLREPEEKKDLAQTLKTFYVEARKKGFVQCIIKQLLDSVFVISRIIKVSARASLSLRLRLITPTSTLIILDITKTSSNNCLITFDKGCWLA